MAYEQSLRNPLNYIAALPAAINVAAMASGKNIWHLKFWQKSPICDQQIKRETYLKKIIINDKTNLIKSTNGGITCRFLSPACHSEP